MALSLWLARGLPRPVLLTAVAALAPAALLLSLPLENLLNIGILSDTFGLIPLLRLSQKIDGGIDTVETLMWIGGFAAALTFALLPRRFARAALPSGVALFLVLSSYAVFGSIRDHSRATLAITGAAEPSWIDEEIGPGSQAAFFYGTSADLFGEAQIMWQTEFWNRSVDTVYTLGPPEPAPLSESAATFDRLTGRIAPEQAPSEIRYAVAPNPVQLAGTLVARQSRLSLYRIERPMRLATLLEGVYTDGWMANDAAFTRYASARARPGRVKVRISRAGWGGPSAPGPVTIRVGPLVSSGGQPAIGSVTASRAWTVRSRLARSFILPTPKPPFRLEIHVGSTFSPADQGRPDPRRLGAQVELRSVS
jgi:hypothetical protein